MTTVEIILIVVGVVFMVGSFFITEKLSQKEITQISELSSIEMKRILEKNMEHAEKTVENMVEDIVGRSMETADRAMGKETNMKIKDISEYAETVVESIHKNHEEVMFLYSMLNDKHTYVEDSVKRLEKLKSELRGLEQEIIVNIADSIDENERNPHQVKELQITEADTEEMLDVEMETDLSDKNQNILKLHRQGMDVVQIAKQLGCGVGEAKLIIALHREGKV